MEGWGFGGCRGSRREAEGGSLILACGQLGRVLGATVAARVRAGESTVRALGEKGRAHGTSYC